MRSRNRIVKRIRKIAELFLRSAPWLRGVRVCDNQRMTTPQAYLMHKQECELRQLSNINKAKEIKDLIEAREKRTGRKLLASRSTNVLGSNRKRA